jgi:hypothetical protein
MMPDSTEVVPESMHDMPDTHGARSMEDVHNMHNMKMQ